MGSVSKCVISKRRLRSISEEKEIREDRGPNNVAMPTLHRHKFDVKAPPDVTQLLDDILLGLASIFEQAFLNVPEDQVRRLTMRLT